jgi:hypothetical protein
LNYRLKEYDLKHIPHGAIKQVPTVVQNTAEYHFLPYLKTLILAMLNCKQGDLMNITGLHLSCIKILMIAIPLFWISGCGGDPEAQARKGGDEIWFEATVHDYGEIPRDGDGSWEFRFRNIGQQAIVINRVRTTCGCTVPSWPREPIEPGGSGDITVEYNTAQTGAFQKSVYVYSSAANSPVRLQIKGKVVAAPESGL